MTPNLLLTVGLGATGVAISLAVAAVGVGVRARHQVEQALGSVERIGALARPTRPAKLSDPVGRRLIAPAVDAAIAIARRLSGAEIASTIQQRLDVAGNPARWDVERVLACKTIAMFGLGLLGLLLGHSKLVTALLFGVCLAGAGFFVPDLLIKNMGIKRQEQIQRTLPDSLDMLTISVEAGLAFDGALSQVARNTTGPVGAEFSRVLQEMRFGKARGDAFRSLQNRTTVPEFRSFVAAIVQADAFGIPIANVLRSQSKEMRLKRRQHAEEKAQKVPLKIMIPVVMCIFPALFVVVLGPGIISALGALHHH